MESMEIWLEEYVYYIRPDYTDMRKQSKRLAVLVLEEVEQDPFR